MNPFQPLEEEPSNPLPDHLRVQTTLEEPVWQTVWRDVKRVGIKLFQVLIPIQRNKKSLRDWDLWGPLVFCLIFAFFMSAMAVQVFVIVWVGAAVVSINSQLLGGKVSFFQSICTLGYSIFPLVVSAIVCFFAQKAKWTNVWFRVGMALGAFAWSTFAALGFLAGMVSSERKVLATYPVLLFYLVLAWMVIVNFG